MTIARRVAMLGLMSTGLLMGAGSPAQATTQQAPAGTVLVTNLDTNTVSMIDPMTGALSSVSGSGLDGPLGIAIAPDGKSAYVTNSLGTTVSPIDLTTTPFRVESPVTVGHSPSAIAISPDGSTAYVSNFDDNTVTPIDLRSHLAETPIKVGAGPWSIAVNGTGTKVIVSNSEATTVSVINTRSHAVTSLSVGGRPEAIAVAPRGDVAYVLSNTQVIPLDLAAARVRVRTPIFVGNKPVGIIMNPSGTAMYTVNADNTVTHIDLTTSPATVAAPVPVSSLTQADGVAVSPNGHTAYIANASNTVTPISLTAGGVLAQTPINVGSASFGIAVVPDQAPIASFTVTNAAAGRLSVFNASASTAPNSTIVAYHWNFGDGVALTTSTPIVQHRYATVGSYSVSLTETTANGTSNVQTFTGQEVSNNGSALAALVRVTSIASPLVISPTTGTPGTAVTVRDATLNSSCQNVNIFFDGLLVAQTKLVGKVLSDASVVIPGNAPVGRHAISVSCSTSTQALLTVAFPVTALKNHLSEFSVAMPNPGTLKKHLASAGLFGLLFLFLGRIFAAGFPSEWMDRTYAKNFERMSRRIRTRFPKLFIDHDRELPFARRLGTGSLIYLVFVAAASLIDSYLSPGFGLNRTSLWLFLGQCVGIGIITLVSQGPIALAGLREKRKVHLHVLVGGLIIAVVCVSASRSLGLSPGYCYGLIAVYVLRPTPSLEAEGRYHFFASLVVLAVATGAFFLTVPVFRAATSAHPSTFALILDPALNMTFLAGFSSVAFGMLPLPFLPGHGVARWSRLAWALLSVVALVGYVAVVLSPGSGTAKELHSAGLIPLMSTFVLFALVSVGFWAYHFRRAKSTGELHKINDESQEDFEVFAPEH